MNKLSKIMITGGTGFLGKAVTKELTNNDYLNIKSLSSEDCDLRNQEDTYEFIFHNKPEVVIHLAAKVGGIGANQKHPGKFFYDNIMMGANLIDACRISKVEKFVQVGTVCSYPSNTPIPFAETELWNGYPEPTNAPYGIAKKALLIMLQGYRKEYNFNGIYLIPVNLYGPGDNLDIENNHIIPALIVKIAQAVKNNHADVSLWGTGVATREFLYVEDCARAIRLAMEEYDGAEPVNVGSGEEITIKLLAKTIAELMGYHGKFLWDKTKPDGQLRRCLDVRKAYEKFGFIAETELYYGLHKTIDWYYKESNNVNAVRRS
jgi:GDP-L-fucose synthase